MHEIILHQYPLSFFAEKIRRILAYKKIGYRSVDQPMTAPKPELTALTGGYRRVPVLQIGADIYCDTELIARRLEQLVPEPSIYPRECAGLATLVEDWADHRFGFQNAAGVIVDLLPSLPAGILDDRAAMSPNLSEPAIRMAAPYLRTQALLGMDRLDAQLASRPFLLGERFSIADAACFHPLWFVQQSPELFEAVRARPALLAWFRRIESFGPGSVRPMSREAALAIAAEADPVDIEPSPTPRLDVPPAGTDIAIVADDYGTERTAGKLVRMTADEIVVQREDDTVGEIAVHFPRGGYRIC